MWFVVQQLDAREVVPLHRGRAHGAREPLARDVRSRACGRGVRPDGADGREAVGQAVVPGVELCRQRRPVVEEWLLPDPEPER